MRNIGARMWRNTFVFTRKNGERIAFAEGEEPSATRLGLLV